MVGGVICAMALNSRMSRSGVRSLTADPSADVSKLVHAASA